MKNILFLLCALLAFASCKHQFDTPPVITSGGGGATTLPKATITIAELKAKHAGGQYETLEDATLVATVVADDRSGNFYKGIVIQDATGGIDLRIDGTSLFNDFPIGRQVAVKLAGLIMGDYNGQIQLGASVDNSTGSAKFLGIAQAVLFDYVIKGATGNPLTPKKTTLAALTAADVSTLIQLDGVEFATADAGKGYADAVNKTTTNRAIGDCNGGTAVVRTSGYASFAPELTPAGNGSFIGIYSIFKTTKQLLVRETVDLAGMTGARCNGSGGTGGTGGTLTPQALPAATMTIAELKAKHTAGNYETLTENKIIVATVVGNDETGNIYKGLVVQDATAGIDLRIDGISLFNDFEIGREVAINTINLVLGDYNGQMQIGAGVDNSTATPKFLGIPFTSITNSVTKGINVKALTPKKTTMSALTDADVSTLIQLDNVEFATADAGQTYADGVSNPKVTINRKLVDCNGGNAVVRSSGYATFAGELTPKGNGTFVGIYSIFKTTKQLLVRETSELVGMTGKLCGGGVVNPGTTEIKIGDLRALFAAGTTVATAGTFIKGVVISDKDAVNITAKNVVVQGTDGKGIVVRLDANNTAALGDAVEITVGGETISEYNGLMQVTAKLTALVNKGKGTLPTPTKLTIQQIKDNFENYESTLVEISDVAFSGGTGGLYKGSTTLTDATGSMMHYTTSYATFAGTAYPSSGAVTVVGIVAQGGTTKDFQLSIRNLTDVK
ncbi:MAG: hypothetical protein RLZZ292_1337 [Bacteroidota bacterium]|jgi:hypothetical protein